jgi:hypothetical protein
LDSAFANFDTETAQLDLPHMRNRKPEAIKRYLEFRREQFKMLLEVIEDFIEEKYPAQEDILGHWHPIGTRINRGCTTTKNVLDLCNDLKK